MRIGKIACGLLALWLAAQTPVVAGNGPKSNLRQFSLQLREQMASLRRGVREGQISKAQAQARFEKLKALHKREMDFYRQNGHRDITASQKDQLSRDLLAGNSI